ncbi:MAG TPA: alpha/beta fold hydrolase [Burkholderiales bacterium]|nr:alpha/beta fold hydrolase [Burkholderiales bacterium]
MSPDLEVIYRPAARKTSQPPIVLVHGAWHGAWCWEGNFLDYFPENGWDTYALSLRGHGASEGRSRLRWISIAEYVEDLASVVSSLERAPILIGHSMGGFVVQKYLEKHRVAGAVLLASVPPTGTARFNLRLIRRHPLVWLTANLLMWLYPVVATPALAGEWFFSPAVPHDIVRRHHAKLQNESYRAALDMLVLDLPHPARADTPIAVLGGELDQMFPVPEVEATGKAYAVTAKIFPGAAHNMMSGPDWRTVADWIGRWASSLPGAAGAAAV